MMTFEEALKYMMPAVLNLYNTDSLDDWSKLAEELGISKEYEHYQGRHEREDTPMSDELKDLLTKLAGPYGKVVLAAFKTSGLPIKIY
jgi:hypothetical protein